MNDEWLEFTVRTYTGEYDLEAGARRIGDDLLVAVWGGEKPHIGAVAAAQSRPSLRNPENISATASVICFPAHKEDELAKAAAEVLAAAINGRVVVTAGIHWDDIGKEGIEKVIRNSEILVDLLLEKVLT